MSPAVNHATGVAGKRARSIAAVKLLLATTKNPSVADECRATLAILESL